MRLPVKELKEHIEVFKEKKESLLLEIEKLDNNIKEFEEEVENQEPNFYLNRVYTRRGFDGEYYCLQISQIDGYCVLYDITSQRFWLSSSNPLNVSREKYGKKRNYITFGWMNVLTGGQAEDFKPLKDEK